ncbi:MAG TPA: hypothetical protein VK610_06230 [Rhodothermales bacterium]|nr:hypothetical protein [Rhodothermales bacterium]
MPLRYTLFFGLAFLPVLAAAQGVVLEARVIEEATGLPLPGATARSGGASAVADRDGQLRLPLPALPARVEVRFLGYRPANVDVAAGGAEGGVVRRTVALARDTVALGEVEVTGENPGDRFWRRVLARRARLVHQTGRYCADGYTRLLLRRHGMLDVGTRPVRLAEHVADVCWREGAGLRERVLARRRRPGGGAFRWTDVDPFTDPYFEDEVVLDGRRYPSPLRADALDYYSFRLGVDSMADGRRLVDIAFTPRRAGLPRGRLRVVDSLYVLAEADLRVEDVPISSPVNEWESTYNVRYAPFTDSLWLPARYTRRGHIFVGLPGSRLPDVYFTQTTLLTRLRPGDGGDGAPWLSDTRLTDAPDLIRGDDLYAPYRLLLPLTEEEDRADRALTYERRTLSRLLRREGFLRRWIRIPVE